jgi:hypothetical protein
MTLMAILRAFEENEWVLDQASEPPLYASRSTDAADIRSGISAVNLGLLMREHVEIVGRSSL